MISQSKAIYNPAIILSLPLLFILSACQPETPAAPVLKGSYYCNQLEMSHYLPEGESVEAVNVCDGYQTVRFDGDGHFQAQVVHRCSKNNSVERYTMSGVYEISADGTIKAWDPNEPGYAVHGMLLNRGNIILGDGSLATAVRKLAQQATCVRIVEEGFPR